MRRGSGSCPPRCRTVCHASDVMRGFPQPRLAQGHAYGRRWCVLVRAKMALDPRLRGRRSVRPRLVDRDVPDPRPGPRGLGLAQGAPSGDRTLGLLLRHALQEDAELVAFAMLVWRMGSGSATSIAAAAAMFRLARAEFGRSAWLLAICKFVTPGL